MALNSMTGFADQGGVQDGTAFFWEARAVNGRGLDLRTRLPEGFESLDPLVREEFGRVLRRGSVTVGLRVGQGGASGGAMPRLNAAALEAAIAAAIAAEARASARGLDLAPVTAADLLGIRGVLEADTPPPSENAPLMAALAEAVPALADRLAAARAAEGRALATLLATRIDRIAELTMAARQAAEARGGRTGALLRERVEALMAMAPVDAGRLAQELAQIAVKADVSEELDRLEAHVTAARVLLGAAEPAGRKLDFLTQEFNREANTLCSKAGAADLTAIGLEMKVVVDQMREQVQNVE